jgi:long-chain acyl-CoA synthetase
MIQLRQDYLDQDRGELEEDIAAFCRENMAAYKKPRTIEFVDELPLTNVGKVDKKALR